MRPAILLLIGVMLLAACRREQSAGSKTAADDMSKLAADAKQADLWKQAAARQDRQLAQFKVAENPVQTRRKVTPAAQPALASARPQMTLPAQQPNAVRILTAPDSAEAAFTGAATIKSIEGERIELDLGNRRTLSLLLRVQSGGLRAKAGETIQVEWRTRPIPEDRMEILAILTPAGQGIVSVLDGATKPVTVEVPLLRLTAAQTGAPEKGSMPVEVTVGEEKQTLRQGQIAEFKSAKLAVGIVSSLAITGEDVNREEGNPYAIRLLAWPVP